MGASPGLVGWVLTRTVHITPGSTADTAEHLASTPSVHVARTSFTL
jgi:hypothetical protein